MGDFIKYNGFESVVRFSVEDNVFHGKLEGIDSLITFEGTTPEKLKAAMREAVEDYLEICLAD